MQIGAATSYPTDTTQYYQVGDMVINSAPAVGQPYGWTCITAGYPGTWVVISLEPDRALIQATTVAPGTTWAAGYRVIVSNANTGTMTLPNAASHAAGWTTAISNINSGALTIAAIATNAIVGTPLSLAQYAFARFVSDGITTWYKVG